ncbi:putative transmembrane protease, serine, partial [Operophtera brumata]
LGRAGSLAATPGEKLLELLRPSTGTPRRHSTAACAPQQPRPTPVQRPSGFVYCPSDALPYCPPSRIPAPPRKINPPPPLIIQPVMPPQPPPVPQRTAPVSPTPLPVPPPAPPRRSSPQPPRRVPPPTPPRPVTTPPTDPNGNRRIAPVSPTPRLDCNKNPQNPKRPPIKMPDNPYTPPPTNGMKRSPSSGSNISVRQDSNVSSESFSQTSSPSYTTKSMEAPLLPHQHVNKSLNAKIARGLMMKEQAEKDASNSAITKSASTPASLQTIVRFQNGSNMSLHHRMLRDIQGATTEASPHKFRLMQLALNAVALLAITGALFAYFRANPAVQVTKRCSCARSSCPKTMRRCGFFLEVFGLSMPDYLQCEIFPESVDTDVCLGNREVKEAKFRANKPVRLSEANGDIGSGELQVYRAANHSWFPACLSTLDETTALKLCSMLGYSWVNKSHAVEGTGSGRVHGAAHSYKTFLRKEGGLLKELRECQQDSTRVHLICNSYGKFVDNLQIYYT